MTLAVLSVDLMDRSHIAAVHPDAVFVRTPAALVERIAAGDITSVVVDLGRAGVLDALEGIVAAGVPVVAYGAHVDEVTLDAARAAGCAEVLARSRFFARLR